MQTIHFSFLQLSCKNKQFGRFITEKGCKIYFFKVLYDRICQEMAAARVRRKNLSPQWLAMKKAANRSVLHTMLTDTIFAFRGIARCSLKLRI